MSQRNIAPVLHQLLLNEFSDKSEWRIDAADLAGKIPDIDYKFPSHIVPLIKAAVNKINRETGMLVDLKVEKPKRGKADLIFRKSSNGTTPEKKPCETRMFPAQPVIRETRINAWESYKSMLKDSFSLYHKTFAHLAKTELAFLKWAKASNKERAALSSEIETKTWKNIMTRAQQNMNSMNRSDREKLEKQTARILSAFATDKNIIALVASLLVFDEDKADLETIRKIKKINETLVSWDELKQDLDL